MFEIMNRFVNVHFLLLVIIGIPCIYAAVRLTKKLAARHFSQQTALVSSRICLYGGWFLLAIIGVELLGYDLTALLGAAGIFGVAIGFAAQSSLSNIISGLFILSEKPFQVDDVIEVDGTTGLVIGVDLLSTKIRTFDNRMVRIPNESILKTKLSNITRYPIRRIDFEVGASYDSDSKKVVDILKQVAYDHPLIMCQPEPLVIFKSFGSSSLDFLLGAWIRKEDYLVVKNEVMHSILIAFRENNIEIPFPQSTIHVSPPKEAFPVNLMGLIPKE